MHLAPETIDVEGRLLSLRDLARLFQVSPASVRRLAAEDERFPEPIFVRPRKARWRPADVRAFVDQL